jgi:tetratricopeptide (TPR) repeat protein
MAQMAAVDSLGNQRLHAAYKSALDKALAADLDNPELWLLRGNAEEGVASGIGQQGGITTVAYYEAAMTRAPNHPAPYHYLVHTYENLSRFKQAVQQGERYAALSPGVPHALHMYGHDLMKTGRIPDAIAFFSRADSLEQTYYNREHISPDLDWHHGHNLSLLGMSHRYLGQMSRAETLFREILALRPFLPEYAFMFKADLISHLLSQGRAGDVLQIAKAEPGATAMELAFAEINAGHALLQLGRFNEARAARDRALAKMPEVKKMFPEWPGFAAFYAQTYIDLLDGMIQFENPATRAEGAEKLRKHAQTVRTLFTGPDEWIAGLFELEDIARLARKRGEWTLAAEMAEQLAAHDAAYAGSFYARAFVAEHKGDRKAARQMFFDAAARWANADAAFDDAATARRKARSQ